MPDLRARYSLALGLSGFRAASPRLCGGPPSLGFALLRAPAALARVGRLWSRPPCRIACCVPEEVFESGHRADRSGGLALRSPPSSRQAKAAMKIVIDYDLCEANAVCMDVCPECFRVEEDDTLTVLVERPPESLRAKVEEAVRLCPRQAISLVED